MFVIPPKKEVTFFEKLCRIFSLIPVKVRKTFGRLNEMDFVVEFLKLNQMRL